MAKQSINVKVSYPAAARPFHDQDAAPAETLASLKARVLTYFRLAEGTQDGNQVTYTLYKGKERLTDLSVTLDALAEHDRSLPLKLVQQIEQGR